MKRRSFIQLDLISLLIPLLLLLGDSPTRALALLPAVFVHECGHLLAARWLHIPICSLRISILGAKLQLADPLLSYRHEWILCAMGPLFSLILAAVCCPLWSELSAVSAALGMINLLPIGCLDGGRMFRASCRTLLTERWAEGVIRVISMMFFLLIWMTSVYLLLRLGNSLTLFVFSISLFCQFFLSNSL